MGNVDSRRIYLQTLLLGFNHQDPSVQSSCLFKAINEMQLILPDISKTTYLSPNFRHVNIRDKQSSLSPSIGATESQHHEIFRLSEIAFSECDFHIRLNAIQQLNVLLVKDFGGYLISTADFNWLINICQACLKFINSFDWYASPHHDHEAESSLFSLQSIILLRNIILSSTVIRNSISLSPDENIQNSLNITPLVLLILKYRLTECRSNLSDKTTLSFDPRHMDLFHLICYEILFIYSCSLYEASFWKINNFGEFFIFDYIEVSNRQSAGNLLLPSFLDSDIYCVCPGQDLQFLYQKYTVQIASSFADGCINLCHLQSVKKDYDLDVAISIDSRLVAYLWS